MKKEKERKKGKKKKRTCLIILILGGLIALARKIGSYCPLLLMKRTVELDIDTVLELYHTRQRRSPRRRHGAKRYVAVGDDAATSIDKDEDNSEVEL